MTRKASGFTLIEVLIALGIVAVLAILAWRGLDEVLRLSARVNAVDQQLQVQSAVFSQFEKDLLSVEQSVFPDIGQQAKIELLENGIVLHVTRRQAGQVPFLEDIHWVWQQGALWRQTRNPLNLQAPAVNSEPIAMPGMQLRLWMEPGGWTALSSTGVPQALNDFAWVLEGAPNTLELNAGNASLVRAVEISLTFPNRQAVRRVFLAGGVQ